MKMPLEYINRLLMALPSGAQFTIVWKNGKGDEYVTRDDPGQARRLANISTGREAFLPFMDIHEEMDYIGFLPMKVEISR